MGPRTQSSKEIKHYQHEDYKRTYNPFPVDSHPKDSKNLKPATRCSSSPMLDSPSSISKQLRDWNEMQIVEVISRDEILDWNEEISKDDDLSSKSTTASSLVPRDVRAKK